jgi:spore coat polysaccharide biosynthesis protein SpsF
MTIGCVILTRASSTRLPRKALHLIKGKTVLKYVVERLEQVVSSDQIVVATSTNPEDEAICELSETLGVRSFRGSLENVAARFLEAAESMGWDFAVRINGDNIFVDVEVLRRMVSIAVTGQYDFVTNVKGRTFPKGMSVEVVNVSYYKSLLPLISSSPAYCEHVTQYLYELADDRKFYYYMNDYLPGAAGIQLALDTPDDLTRTENIINQFTRPQWEYDLTQIFNIWTNLNNEERV